MLHVACGDLSRSQSSLRNKALGDDYLRESVGWKIP